MKTKTKKQIARQPRKRHQLRSVSNNGGYKFHCVHCDKYFAREPFAYTCKPPKGRSV
jgi:hypothetical protein